MPNSKFAPHAIIGVVLAAVFLIFPVTYRASSTTEQITVKEKLVKRSGDSDRYLVTTSTNDVLEITDSVSYFRFNSSNTYAELEPGKTYTVTLAGWRVPFFSMKRNIVEIK